jgi:hypothetical protein
MTDSTSPSAPMHSHAPTGLGALLDFSFKHFITLSVIKVLYLLFIVLIAIGWLGMVIMGFVSGGILGGLGALIIGTVVVVIEVIAVRVWLELICVIFRIGENTTALVERGRV